jgi:hypothetical protein
MRYEEIADWALEAEKIWIALDVITSKPGWAENREAVEAVSGLISVLGRPIANLADHHARGGASHSET